MAYLISRIRRAVGRVVPEPIRHRLRRKPKLLGSRNVDVVLDDQRQVRKWLRATPDTYRVWGEQGLGPGPDADHRLTDRVGQIDPAAVRAPTA